MMRDFSKFGGGQSEGPTELIGYLSGYLALPSPPLYPEKAKGAVAVCPGFLLFAPNPPWDKNFEGYSYFCSRLVYNSTNEILTNVFGYLDGSQVITALPKRAEDLARPAVSWALVDADKVSIARCGPWMSPWRVNLPNGPVHDPVWNRLYFDGHADSVKKLEQRE
jgi:hypothetical protein